MSFGRVASLRTGGPTLQNLPGMGGAHGISHPKETIIRKFARVQRNKAALRDVVAQLQLRLAVAGRI